MALKYFAQANCDLVIWETGLGGRLDATNIVTPLASVITNIQLDHQQWLGESLAKIAFEKAGIIKPGIPVISAVEGPEAVKVIEQISREQKSRLKLISSTTCKSALPDTIKLPLVGEHQRLNAALAIETVNAI